MDLPIGGVVDNQSNEDIYVIGERPMRDEHEQLIRDKDGNIQFETVKVRLRPWESSTDYEIIDADYVQPIDPIDGHTFQEVYKLPDLTRLTVRIDLLGRTAFKLAGIGKFISRDWGWRPKDASGVCVPDHAINEPNTGPPGKTCNE